MTQKIRLGIFYLNAFVYIRAADLGSILYKISELWIRIRYLIFISFFYERKVMETIVFRSSMILVVSIIFRA